MSGQFDALLVLSFGGPEAPADVMPFLERVTSGRGVPQERLLEVAKHYDHFGGVSPINQRNRELIDRVRVELADQHIELPVYFGNRNWHPLVEDTLAELVEDGVRRALVLATSAYGGYSACRQYHEDIERAPARGRGQLAPELVKLRHFFDHPEFVASVTDAVRSSVAQLPDVGQRDQARLVFTAHSIPGTADRAAGVPAEGGHRYSRQVAEAARLVAAELGVTDYDVVWQIPVRSAERAVVGAGHPAPPGGVAHQVGARRGGVPGGVRQRPCRGHLGPGQRGQGLGAGARHGVRPRRYLRAGPPVRPDGSRAGARADRRCAGPCAGPGVRSRSGLQTARRARPTAPPAAAPTFVIERMMYRLAAAAMIDSGRPPLGIILRRSYPHN